MPPSFDPNPFSFFPRPSGRGSIAAPTTTTAPDSGAHLPPAIRPGLHCGFPAVVVVSSGWPASPGHQAGAPLRRREGRGPGVKRAGLPPAIRPGLHCGGASHGGYPGALVASPGHQAGAPLRLAHVVEHVGEGVDFPRPSGRGSIAASTHIFQVSNGGAVFPRPSGRGSIAAVRAAWASRIFLASSPGHQAGAPLRQRRV